jgi:hypothetical protein
LLSLFRSVLGTGRSSKFPPDRKYLRYAQLQKRAVQADKLALLTEKLGFGKTRENIKFED